MAHVVRGLQLRNRALSQAIATLFVVNDLVIRCLSIQSPAMQRFVEAELEKAIANGAGGNLTGRDILERLRRSASEPESTSTRERNRNAWFIHKISTDVNPHSS